MKRIATIISIPSLAIDLSLEFEEISAKIQAVIGGEKGKEQAERDWREANRLSACSPHAPIVFYRHILERRMRGETE